MQQQDFKSKMLHEPAIFRFSGWSEGLERKRLACRSAKAVAVTATNASRTLVFRL